MKICERIPCLALGFIALGHAQEATIVVNTSDTDVVTSYYSVCPSSTTITLPDTTITCAGDVCGLPTQERSLVTKTGNDGRTTVYRTETTILPHMCPKEDGVCGATYTLSEECPCHAYRTASPDQCPEWFTTTVVVCAACVKLGGHETVTLTTPVAEGPYATVIPDFGPPVSAPAAITQSPAPISRAQVSDASTISELPASLPVGPVANPVVATNGIALGNYTAPFSTNVQPYLGSGSRVAVSTLIVFGLIGVLAVVL